LDGTIGHTDVMRFAQSAGPALAQTDARVTLFHCIDDEFRYFVLSMLVVRNAAAA